MLTLRNKIDLPHKKLFDGAHYFLTREKILVGLNVIKYYKYEYYRRYLMKAIIQLTKTKFTVENLQ